MGSKMAVDNYPGKVVDLSRVPDAVLGLPTQFQYEHWPAFTIQNLLANTEANNECLNSCRFISSSRHHPATGVPQAHGNETLVASSETRGKKVDGDRRTDANKHSKRIHESVADRNGETVSVWDTTTVMRRACEKRLQSQDDGHESKRCMRSRAQC